MPGKGVVWLKVLLVVVAVAVAGGCTTRLRTLEGANQQLVAQRESLNQEIADLKAKLAEKGQSTGDLMEQIKKLQTDLTYWQGQAEAYREANEKLKKIGVTGVSEKFLRELAGKIGGIYLEGGGIRLASDVLFDSGKTSLKPSAVAAMQKAADAFQSKDARDLHLRIDGHTDNVPIKFSKWKDNMELSQARARAVWVELRKYGVAPERMFTAGFGEFAPIDDNSTPAGRANNRRVEIWLVPPPAAVEVSK